MLSAGLCAPPLSFTPQSINSTACGEAKAAADAAIQAGDASIEAAQGQLDLLRRGGAPASQVALQAQVASAQALVKATRARLDALTNGGVQAQRAQLQALHDQAASQLTAAQDNLNVAHARLQAAQSGTLDAQRKAAQAQVDAAREKLKSDQARFEQIVSGPQDEEVQAAQDAITQAEQQAQLASQPVTQQDVEAQRALVNQAQQQVQKAQQPYTVYDLDQQQHVVAQAALELARLGVRETQIVAPVDGMVLDRQVSAGALVGPTSPIVVLIPPSLEVAINVDEAQLGSVSQGQSVALQVPAYPSETFAGTVSAVAPAIDQKSRTASVRIQPKDDAGKLRPGMLAQVGIITATQPDALLVPREAIIGTPVPNGQATIITLDDGRAQRTNVRLGLVSDQVVQVSSGLGAGQVVAIGNANGLNNGDVVVPQLRSAVATTGVQQ